MGIKDAAKTWTDQLKSAAQTPPPAARTVTERKVIRLKITTRRDRKIYDRMIADGWTLEMQPLDDWAYGLVYTFVRTRQK